MSKPKILVTGGTGKTGSRVAVQLDKRGASVVVASRSGTGIGIGQPIKFDWMDEASHDAALEGVTAVYLLAPAATSTPIQEMRPFIDRAIERGVKRFVLLSASLFDETGPMMGEVHAYLKQVAPEWAVLRPTWFAQNFSEQQHLPTIKNERKIYSATVDGRVPFVDADDIAAVGAVALMGAPLNRDIIITGPKPNTYTEVANVIGDAIGKPIEHVNLTVDELTVQFLGLGFDADYAATLASLDAAIASGVENRVTSEVETLTGRAPIDIVEFARRNMRVWL